MVDLLNNKHVRFGVNCFGEKPEETEQDKGIYGAFKIILFTCDRPRRIRQK